ncbi:MAG TPA: hypothetical protein VFL66_09240 [Gaiellaceae bacterium]|nr:hypothetical protein [Gaiellaceae bacterium]
MADARHVQFARELEERDARVAAALDELQQLRADVAELRTHADGVESFLAAYPGERARLDGAVAAGRERLTAREAERAAAESELARARGDEEAAAARRAVTRTKDAESSARRRLERAADELAALEREAARVDETLPRLPARAAELSARLETQRRVSRTETIPADLPTVRDWTTEARAALFVATAGLETERERIVREANDLGAAVLHDPTAATSVSLVRERIERA